MNTSLRPSSPWRLDAGFGSAPVVQAAVAALVFLLVYGAELGTFTLSVDEEVAAIEGVSSLAWLAQGRWGMALFTAVMPPIEAVPVIATALFGLGLGLATLRAVRDLRLDGWRALAFIVLHVGFPLWPHIVEFSTLAAGFGAAIAACVIGVGLLVRGERTPSLALGLVLVAFAVGVYQTLAPYAVLYALMLLHAEVEDGTLPTARALLARGGGVLVRLVAAFAAYLLVQRGLSAALSVPGAYIDGYWKLDALLATPGPVVEAGLAGLAAFTLGTHALYLGQGAAILALPALGLVPAWLRALPADRRLRAGMVFAGVVLAGLVLLALPMVLTADTLPIRAHIVLPLLAAWLASRTRWPAMAWSVRLQAVALAYVAVCAGTIGATLFQSEQLARQADAALVATLVPAIRNAGAPLGTSPIPFTMSGDVQYDSRGTIPRVGIFGSSIFGHYSGHVMRVGLYLQVLGERGLAPVHLQTRPDLVAAAAGMPDWPAPGSVALVNGVVIVRFGPATATQLKPLP